MTVVREDYEEFDLPATSVVAAIKQVLNVGQRKYTYRSTEIGPDGTCFETVVTPNVWPLLLKTRMSITVKSPKPAMTMVTVRTQSQRMISGDVFNFYRGYIRDLLRSLRLALPTAE